jgi:hypothetical protein
MANFDTQLARWNEEGSILSNQRVLFDIVYKRKQAGRRTTCSIVMHIALMRLLRSHLFKAFETLTEAL